MFGAVHLVVERDVVAGDDFHRQAEVVLVEGASGCGVDDDGGEAGNKENVHSLVLARGCDTHPAPPTNAALGWVESTRCSHWSKPCPTSMMYTSFFLRSMASRL